MSSRDRRIGSIVTGLLIVCCVASVAFAVPADAQSVAFPQADDQPSPDNTITRIELTEDGSATWEITLRTRLENESDLSEYERFQGRFRSNTSRYLDPFEARMTGVVAAANRSSPRKMRAASFEAETRIQEVPRRWGVVTFRFTWGGFAAIDGDAVVVGDVFDGGFFIGDDDVLAITAPDGYAIADASPTPDERDTGTVEWRGREDFADTHPSVKAVPTATGDSGGKTTGEGSGGWLTTGNGPVVLVLVALLFAGALVLVAFGIRTGRIALGSDDSNGGGSAATAPDTEGGILEAGEEETPQNSTDPHAIDPALLTDEDRVKRALRKEGGRMKQSDVVDAFGWSKSKTSRVLSQMADDDAVEKLRIGRENVIDLVDDE